jgi:hypothetical protein
MAPRGPRAPRMSRGVRAVCVRRVTVWSGGTARSLAATNRSKRRPRCPTARAAGIARWGACWRFVTGRRSEEPRLAEGKRASTACRRTGRDRDESARDEPDLFGWKSRTGEQSKRPLRLSFKSLRARTLGFLGEFPALDQTAADGEERGRAAA